MLPGNLVGNMELMRKEHYSSPEQAGETMRPSLEIDHHAFISIFVVVKRVDIQAFHAFQGAHYPAQRL
jgi:hypothetical protein